MNSNNINVDDPIKIILDNEYGHQRSKEEGSAIDCYGKPIPWMTYPAISYIRELDLKSKSVFEWGGGNSSLFFSKLVKTITTIELKQEWYDYVVSNKLNNMIVKHANDVNYAEIINDSEEKYDVIIIDGEIDRRFECAQTAIDHLASNGMIILDNSDWLTNTCKFLRDSNLIQVDMAGFGPINDYTWCTSFFLTRDFNFLSCDDKRPAYTLGGIKNVRD